MLGRRRAPAWLALAVAVGAILVGSVLPAGAVGSTWPAYLFSPTHRSRSGSTAISPANVGTLSRAWAFSVPVIAGRPATTLFASPIVSGGRVFIGSNSGVFYALRQSTGGVLWSREFGFVTQTTCNSSAGIRSTVTVAPDPATGASTVYLVTGDAHLVALDAATGATRWDTVIETPSTTENDYYIWASPTVANGHVYIGISSQCDHPLVRGGLKMFDQSTGALENTWFSVPEGQIGGSIWSSAAADARSVFVTTGNSESGVDDDSNSIVRLSASTLERLGGWQVPIPDQVVDSDFGGSPTIFYRGGSQYVGACNKNGTYYLLDASSMNVVWQRKLSPGSPAGTKACLAAAAWDGSHLFVAAPYATIAGTTYNGSIRMLDPVDGSSVWEAGLPGIVIGSPSINAAGVLAVPMYDKFGGSNGVVLVDASNGTILRTLPSTAVFAQPAFAGKYLFVAQDSGKLTAYRVP